MCTLGRMFTEYILGVMKSGRPYQLSPRYHAATGKPIFVQILGRGILVIIYYGDWFCGEKKSHMSSLYIKSSRNSFVES